MGPSGDSARLAEAFVDLVHTVVDELDVHELLPVLVDRFVSCWVWPLRG